MPVDEQLAIAQALKYAEELRQLHAAERAQRRAAEEALAQLEESYGSTVRARIFAVVDAFDAITNDRPYRRALPFDVGVAQIHQGAGTQFEPAVADAFLSLAGELRSAA